MRSYAVDEILNSLVERDRFYTKLTKGNRLSRVVVLGAGASVSAGIPMSNTLLMNIIRFNTGRQPWPH